MYNNEILKSIDIINEAQLDAEYAVLESMIEAYDKASMILESYEGDNLDAFNIFQESVIMESDDEQTNEPVAKGNHFRRVGADGKKEKLIKSILMAIPRLFTWLAKKIKSLWNKRPAAKLKKEISDLKNTISKMDAESKRKMDAELKRKMDDVLAKAKKYTNGLEEYMDAKNDETYNKINSLRSDMDAKIDKIIADGNQRFIKIEKYVNNKNDVFDYKINSLRSDIDDNYYAIKGNMSNTKESIDKLNESHQQMYMDIKRLEECVGAHINASNKTISLYWDIDKAIENCNNMMKVIDKLGNYNFHKPSSGKFELPDGIDAYSKYEPSKASTGKFAYSLDDFVNKASQVEKMTISISDKVDAIATKISADLKSYDTTKATKDDSVQKLKVETANKILKDLNRISRSYAYYSEETHHDIVRFTKYTAFYNKVAAMYATGYAPTRNVLHFKNGQDLDEARSVFNTKS